MNYDQLKVDLYWELRPLLKEYNIDEDCHLLFRLISQAHSEGYSEGLSDGDLLGSYL